jgi:hypothetical protein
MTDLREYQFNQYQRQLDEADLQADKHESRLKEIEQQFEKLGKPAQFEVYVAGEYHEYCDHISEALLIAELYDEEITLKHCDDEMA